MGSKVNATEHHLNSLPTVGRNHQPCTCLEALLISFHFILSVERKFFHPMIQDPVYLVFSIDENLSFMLKPV